MAQRRRGPTRRATKPFAIAIALVLLVLGARGNLDGVFDRLDGADDPPEPVTLLQEGSTPDAQTPQTWTLDVPAGQTLVVDARAVVLVREDEGSRLDNTSPDRILLAAEGGHPYTLTLEDGRWAVVAERDGRQEFCNRDQVRGGDWGVRYMPGDWGSDPC